jgi:hypothetical protein
MIDPDAIASAASARLGVPAADLTQSANAALEYIAADISTTTDLLNPDSALLFEGARLLTERIYQDVSTRTGELDAFGSVTMSGVMIPENLGKHLRHYWLQEQRAWGIG